MSYDKIVNPELNLCEDRDYGALQNLSVAFLCAAINGQFDVRELLEYELAARGYDHDGNWIGLSTRTNPVLAKYASRKAGLAKRAA